MIVESNEWRGVWVKRGRDERSNIAESRVGDDVVVVEKRVIAIIREKSGRARLNEGVVERGIRRTEKDEKLDGGRKKTENRLEEGGSGLG